MAQSPQIWDPGPVSILYSSKSSSFVYPSFPCVQNKDNNSLEGKIQDLSMCLTLCQMFILHISLFHHWKRVIPIIQMKRQSHRKAKWHAHIYRASQYADFQPEPVINPPCGVPAAGVSQEHWAPICSLPFQFDKIMYEKVLCWLSVIPCNRFHSLWIAVWGLTCLNF